MTTLNARANQAYRDMEAELERDDCVPNFVSEQDAYEEGWESGYATAAQEMLQWLRGKRAEAITSERQGAYDRGARSG